ncbi:hypothetical protein ACFQ1L_11690 [Phytohabitans flavus]|uniref:hypothetical protein n=1 Tax=Phytohabitans flavus TaxID=1076124 RepID=UPI003625E1DE
MHVLFLGGPWHGERHEVVPSRRARGSEGLPQQYSVRESSTTAARAAAYRA